MENLTQPYIDGERIPDDVIQDIFRQPPEVPPVFFRNALIIGSRGAGKTTLFRYQKAVHKGIAVHISLVTEFAILTKQTGLGPLSFDFQEQLEKYLVGKATSLLALSISGRLIQKGVLPNIELLNECLPIEIRQRGNVNTVDAINELKSAVTKAPLEMFASIASTRPLPAFAEDLGQASARIKGPLLLLLDRADMILSPALVPIIEMLDQSGQFMTLVAMRPGHGGRSILPIGEEVVSGDHYDTVHLGANPSSSAWTSFVKEAIKAQVENKWDTIPEEICSSLLTISRDSVRIALELFSRYLNGPKKESKERLIASLEDIRENQLTAAQRTLQRYHPDFRRMIADLRKEIIRKNGRILGPTLLSVSEGPRLDLFDANPDLVRFIEVGLRAGALCMPDGQRWVPGLRITDVEIPPILLWQKGDELWVRGEAPTTTITRKENEVLRYASGGAIRPPSIFVAYRMDFQESKNFRKAIEKEMKIHPDFQRWKVEDGHVPDGVRWPDKIRDRIRKAKVVVGDVTGMRPDVMFELGFAYGLGKVVIPCVSNQEAMTDLPDWFSSTQVADFSSQGGIRGILSSISTQISSPEFVRKNQARQPVPSLWIFLQPRDWCGDAVNQIIGTAQKEGLKFEKVDDNYSDDIALRKGAQASLFIGVVDGSPRDALVHYICGSIVARPKSGYGRVLDRTILITQKDPSKEMKLVAGSLRRCSDIVKIIKSQDINSLAIKCAFKYRDWTKSASKTIGSR